MPRGYHKPLTQADEQKIKDEFLLKPVKRLADELGISYGRVMRFLKNNGLEIPRELIEQRKKDSQKKKGDVSFNKGKKQSDYMTPEAIERTRATRFKKGHTPHNAKGFKNGDISIIKDSKTERRYKFIRVSKNKWELLHRNLWERENGKIPEGYCLVFKDGNSLNCDLSNLELITRAEHLDRNWHNKYPQELKKTIKKTQQIKKDIKTKDRWQN